MSARPQRTARPTAREKAAASGKNASPSKRKARESSSPEVEIVEDKSPPRTPSPSKPKARPTARPSNAARRATDSEAGEITDPQFFDDPISVPAVEEYVDDNSDEYWRHVDSVHESDIDFIDDSAVVEGGDGDSDDEMVPWRPRPKAVKALKGKARMRVTSEISDAEVPEEAIAHSPKKKNTSKGKARMLVDSEVSDAEVPEEAIAHSPNKKNMGYDGPAEIGSDSDDAGLSAHELKQIAEAKQLSMVGTASANRKGSTSKSVVQGHASDVFSAESAKPVVARQSKLLKAMDGSASAVPKKSDVTIGHDTVYLEDLEVGVRGEHCPPVCQVKNPDDEDPNINYVGECNLAQKDMRSWSDDPHMGLGTFSAWGEQCPNINKKQLKKLFEFHEHGHIRNASRTVPSNLAGKVINGGNTILIAAGSRDTVIQFTTILFVTAPSKLHDLQDILNEKCRAIEGVPQIVEWERMQSVLCMAHNIPYANINMRAGAITFCTGKTLKKLYNSGGSSPAKNPATFLKKRPLTAGAQAAVSPFKVPKSTVTGDAIIPILDARGDEFNLESDLLELDKKLPLYLGEVPEGSCVWVGYTSTKYTGSNRAIGMNFNLMWVVVVGTP
ncbi:hypothetical protein HWV62_7942 [Athelia sp. TMB]|nr:hypothetical protein HWV62_7942 [Athelia sp. TMB]